MRSTARGAWLAGAGLAVVLQTSAARAQQPPAAGTEAATAPGDTAAGTSPVVLLFEQGVAAARAGRWAEALELFTRCYQIAPRPPLLLNVGTAQMHLGRLVAAAESYRRFLRTATPDELREDGRGAAAQARLAEIERRIPRARVVRTCPRTGRVLVDGRAAPGVALGGSEEIALDPGTHAAVVQDASGMTAAARSFELREGERRVVDLTGLGCRGCCGQRDAAAAARRRGGGVAPWVWGVVAGAVGAAAVAGVVGCAAAGCFAPVATPGSAGIASRP